MAVKTFLSTYLQTCRQALAEACSGRSRISQTGGGRLQLPWWGHQPIIWPNFYQNLHENERIWTRGGTHPWCHPLDGPMLWGSNPRPFVSYTASTALYTTRGHKRMNFIGLITSGWHTWLEKNAYHAKFPSAKKKVNITTKGRLYTFYQTGRTKSYTVAVVVTLNGTSVTLV